MSVWQPHSDGSEIFATVLDLRNRRCAAQVRLDGGDMHLWHFKLSALVGPGRSIRKEPRSINHLTDPYRHRRPDRAGGLALGVRLLGQAAGRAGQSDPRAAPQLPDRGAQRLRRLLPRERPHHRRRQGNADGPNCQRMTNKSCMMSFNFQSLRNYTQPLCSRHDITAQFHATIARVWTV